ncbi:hypothetical protein DFH27DRAFT_603945 [Peziza echinospora]|nr:hypothetical protein DFH27DRAFT_603945 [Peziza echinospora]
MSDPQKAAEFWSRVKISVQAVAQVPAARGRGVAALGTMVPVSCPAKVARPPARTATRTRRSPASPSPRRLGQESLLRQLQLQVQERQRLQPHNQKWQPDPACKELGPSAESARSGIQAASGPATPLPAYRAQNCRQAPALGPSPLPLASKADNEPGGRILFPRPPPGLRYTTFPIASHKRTATSSTATTMINSGGGNSPTPSAATLTAGDGSDSELFTLCPMTPPRAQTLAAIASAGKGAPAVISAVGTRGELDTYISAKESHAESAAKFLPGRDTWVDLVFSGGFGCESIQGE